MCRVEREIEKERLRRVLLDVTDGAIAERVREVGHRRGGLYAIEQRVRHIGANIDMGNIHIRMVTAEEPIELFKSATHRVQSIRRTEVPFAEQGRAVSGSF